MLTELEAAGRNVGVSAKALAATLPIESFDSWMQGYSRVVAPAFLPLEERNAWFLEAHISRLKAQKVSYAEIFLSGFLGVREDIGEMVELFRRLRESLVRAAAPDLEIELVACVGRNTPERLARQSPRILALWDAGLICGVSLAGDESLPLLPLRPFFERFRDSGLGIEIHAGETRGPESVRTFGLTEADFARIFSDIMSARFQGRRSPKAPRS
jgi:adenosine deaminase